MSRPSLRVLVLSAVMATVTALAVPVVVPARATPVPRASLAAMGTAASPVPRGDAFTIVTGAVINALNPVLGADNRRHLAYEVRLQNSGPFPVALRRLDALDRRSGAVLARHAGAALAALVRPAEGGTCTGTIGPGRTVYAVLEVALARRARVPRGLTHRISIAFDPRKAPPGFRNPSPYAIAPTTVAHHGAVVLASPLRGSGWVAANGCCNELTSHRGAVIPVNGHLRVPERFAIDFVQLDAHGRLFTGPVGRLSSYAYYGTDVLSVAGGTVVRTHDGEPEQTPPNPPSTVPTPDSAGGNWVMVDIGDGNVAFYAHLQQHSLAVRVGDRVRKGERIGLLGNTGNSTAPHLHFHISSNSSPLDSNGLPYRFARFGSTGTVTDTDALFAGRPTPVGPRLAGEHRRQLPLNLEVVDLG
jgi:Peptidase family M23